MKLKWKCFSSKYFSLRLTLDILMKEVFVMDKRGIWIKEVFVMDERSICELGIINIFIVNVGCHFRTTSSAGCICSACAVIRSA